MKMTMDLNNFGCAIVVYKNDECATILEANDAFYQIVGYTKGEMEKLFKNRFAQIIVDDSSRVIQSNQNIKLSESKSLEQEFKIMHKDRKIVYIKSNASYDKINDVFHVVLMDVTEKETAMAELRNNSKLDEVTKLPSLETFKKLSLELLVNNSNEEFVMSKINIENFDIISEIFGSEKVNKLLRIITILFEQHKFSKANISRIGVDEFIAITSRQECRVDDFGKFTDKRELYKLIKKHIPSMMKHKISFNVGVYTIKKGSYDIENAINKVSMAHRRAKANDTSVIEYSDEIKEHSILKVDITNRMEEALINKEFVPYFQPQFDINSKKIIGAEALARWVERDNIIYYPNVFIPIFEKNGFIIDFDMFMLEYTCKTLREWLQIGYECVPISINFSKIHFGNPKFVEDIVDLVDRYCIPHELILVEMTETALMENEVILLETLKELKNNGFKVAIDDFGTGYSSLSVLKDYDFNVLKLDKSFFLVHKTMDRDNNIIRHIIQMSKELNMEFVAEGIETKEQVKWLQSMNCEIAQGYYFSYPITEKEFKKLLICRKVV